MNRQRLITLAGLACACAFAVKAGEFGPAIAQLDNAAAFERIVAAGSPAVPELLAALKGPQAGFAIRALGRIGAADAVSALAACAADPDGERRAAIAWALGRCGAQAGLDTLLKLTQDPYAPARAAAVHALSSVMDESVGSVLERALADPAADVRRSAALAIAQGKRTALWKPLAARLEFAVERVPDPGHLAGAKDPAPLIDQVVWAESDLQTRLTVVQALAAIQVPDALPALIASLERADSFSRQATVRAIESMGPSAAPVCLGRIVPLAYDQDNIAKHMPILLCNGHLAVVAGRLGDARCVPHLLDSLKLPADALGKDMDLTELFIQTVELLGKFRCERAAAPLAELYKRTEVLQLSQALERSLLQLGSAPARPLARNLDDYRVAPQFFRLLRRPELRTHAARDGILKFLAHESEIVRLEATETLGLYLYESILDEYDFPMLEAMYLDPNAEIRGACARWKKQIEQKSGNEVRP
ncbi:MAG: hypothetical protein AMXMBFR7_22310 [Planctomycetota bacterium]